MAVLLEASLTFLLLGRHVVRDEGVVTFLCERVLAFNPFFVHCLFDLHNFVDTSNVIIILLLGILSSRGGSSIRGSFFLCGSSIGSISICSSSSSIFLRSIRSRSSCVLKLSVV